MQRWAAALVLCFASLAVAAERPPGSAQRPLRLCTTASAAVPESLWREAALPAPAQPQVDAFLMALLARKLGLSIQVEVLPSRRCPVDVEAGRFDGALGLSATEERMRWGAYPMRGGQPDEALRYTRQGYFFYTRQGAPWTWDGQRLGGDRPARIGMIQGYSGVALLRDKGFEVQETSANTEQLLRMLQAGRFDAVALPQPEADAVLARVPALREALERREPAVLERTYFLVLRRPLAQAHPAWAQQLWQTLGELRETDWARQAWRAAL